MVAVKQVLFGFCRLFRTPELQRRLDALELGWKGRSRFHVSSEIYMSTVIQRMTLPEARRCG